mgnify:CR=1 FL=1
MLVLFAYAAEVPSSHACPASGRRRNILILHGQYLRNPVDNEPDSMLAGVDHDNTGSVGILFGLFLKLQAHINNREYFSAEINDAPDMLGSLGYRVDRLQTDNLFDEINADAENLFSQSKCQVSAFH